MPKEIHGHAYRGRHTKEYRAWVSMRGRCFDKRDAGYHNYGGRGITVCERWLVFENFLEDLGLAPSPSHTLDRINVDGNYCPDNCKWATRKEQANNRRDTRKFNFRGKIMTLTEIAAVTGINYKTINVRLYRGWSPERAFK